MKKDKSTGILTSREDGTVDYRVINEWQLCPKCDGSGVSHNVYTNNAINTVPCNLCNGKMIISKIDGNPPE